MIQLAKAYGAAPVLTLTPFGPDGRFNNALISSVVNNLNARETLKNEIIEQITSRGFQGLDIDFEYILASDRDAFVDFVTYMREAVSALGYLTSVALAPKTSDTQTGLLYEGKDYRKPGETADYVLLMTYEWGYTYGPPMAVAPLNKVRKVVEYAVTVIPPDKIHLGFPCKLAAAARSLFPAKITLSNLPQYVLFPVRSSYAHDHLPGNRTRISLLFCSLPACSASKSEVGVRLQIVSYLAPVQDHIHTPLPRIIRTGYGFW